MSGRGGGRLVSSGRVAGFFQPVPILAGTGLRGRSRPPPPSDSVATPPRPVYTPDLHLPDLDRTTLRLAAIGGGVAALTMGVGVVVIGVSTLTAGNARGLLEATLPTARALFTTAMIASSTTLALMLTMLGLTAEQSVKSAFYGQIRQASTLAVGVFSIATIVVILLSIPFQEGSTGETPYTVLYFVISGIGALVGGGLVAVMITLHQTIGSLIGLVDDDSESDIAVKDDDDDEPPALGGPVEVPAGG